MTVFIQLRNYSQASCTDDLCVKIVTMSFKNLSGSCRVLWHTEWLNILITFGFPSKKVYAAFMLVFFLSSVGTAHRLCSWCHRNAQCGRCQYYRVYRWLLCLCKVVLCPITSHPCNKQVGSWEKLNSSLGPVPHTLLFGLDSQEFQHEIAKHQGSLLAVCFK